jgi:hypothetical protein
MGDRSEQILIDPCGIQDDFTVVCAMDGIDGHDKIARVLDIHDDLRTAFRRHLAHRPALFGTFLDKHLKTDPDGVKSYIHIITTPSSEFFVAAIRMHFSHGADPCAQEPAHELLIGFSHRQLRIDPDARSLGCDWFSPGNGSKPASHLALGPSLDESGLNRNELAHVIHCDEAHQLAYVHHG